METVQSTKLTLGRSLAYLRVEMVFGKDYSSGLQKSDIEYLNQLKLQAKRVPQTASFKDLLYKARDVLDVNSMNQTEHWDFFLNLFLVDTSDKDCYKLAKVLNNHYDWFEGFSQVLSDFSITYNKLKKKNLMSVK